MRLKITFLLFCFCMQTNAHAQQDQYSFSRLNVLNGLSNNQINSIFKDGRGFMWFGTMSGLNRYDGYNFKIFKYHNGDSTTISDDYINEIFPGPRHTLWISTPGGWNIFDSYTEKFSSHLQKALHEMGLPNESFTNIIPDGKNNFWFVFPGKGLYKYDASAKKTFAYNKSSKYFPLYSDNITFLSLDRSGSIWISYAEGVIEKRDGANNTLLFRSNILQQYAKIPAVNYRMFVDADNDIWIYSSGETKGIYYFNTSSKSLLSITKDSKRLHLNNDIIKGITEDAKGNIWVATDHGGINSINKKTLSITYLKNDCQNSVNAIYKDNTGII